MQNADKEVLTWLYWDQVEEGVLTYNYYVLQCLILALINTQVLSEAVDNRAER